MAGPKVSFIRRFHCILEIYLRRVNGTVKESKSKPILHVYRNPTFLLKCSIISGIQRLDFLQSFPKHAKESSSPIPKTSHIDVKKIKSPRRARCPPKSTALVWPVTDASCQTIGGVVCYQQPLNALVPWSEPETVTGQGFRGAANTEELLNHKGGVAQKGTRFQKELIPIEMHPPLKGAWRRDELRGGQGAWLRG